MDRTIETLVRQVAANYARMRGRAAITDLMERAETAEESGDIDSAILWWAIAITTAELLHPIS